MPEPTDRSDHTDRVDADRGDADRGDADRGAGDDHEAEQRRAARIYRDVGAENPDPVTRREAIEGELEDEGLSEAGGHLGEHND